MSKHNALIAAVTDIPDEYAAMRNVLFVLLSHGSLAEMRTYSLGMYDMAVHLTSDETLLAPLRHVRSLLK